MATFTNDSSLLAAITMDIHKSMETLSEVIVETVKDSVKEIVYDPYTHLVKKYERLEEHGGFLGSWRSDKHNARNKISFWVYSDADMMTYEPDKFQHGAMGEDRRDIMDRAIAEGSDYDFEPAPEGGEYWWATNRDYWTPVISELNEGGLDRFVRYSFSANQILIG